MEEKPDLVAVPILLLWISLAGYYTYRSWFDPDGLASSLKRDINRLPSWYPTKTYSLSRIGSKSWLWGIRIISTISVVISIFLFVLVIYLLVK